MDAKTVERYGDEIYAALIERRTVAPLLDREPEITIDEAYRIQLRMVEQRSTIRGAPLAPDSFSTRSLPPPGGRSRRIPKPRSPPVCTVQLAQQTAEEAAEGE